MADVLRFDIERKARRSDESARTKAGRRAITKWLQHVNAEIRSGALSEFDSRLAQALVNFPSAVNEGTSWPGQLRLIETLSKSDRSIRNSLRRLENSALLCVERRGRNRTNRYTFCLNGVPIISPALPDDRQHDRQKPADPDRQFSAGQNANDRQFSAAESYKLTESIKRESPPNPPTSAAQADKPQGHPMSGVVRAVDHRTDLLDGEVLGPGGDVTFNEFWKALREQPGPTGPALARWRKLARDERRAIGNLIGPQGIDLDGMWAVTWLANRRWERERLRSTSILAVTERRVVDLKPYSVEWTAERNRKLAAGESVKLMETWAMDGRGWTVQVMGSTHDSGAGVR